MKLAVFSAALCATLSFAQAQDLTVNGANQVELENKTISEEKTIDISVGYTSESAYKDAFKDSLLSGVSLSVGRIFDLSKGFSTTTSLIGSYVSHSKKTQYYDDGNYNFNATVKLSMLKLGIAQRFSYSIETGFAIIKPFIEADFSFIGLEESVNDQTKGALALKSFGGGLGLQASFANGISPYIKYNNSWISPFTNPRSELPISKALSIGVGYVF